MMRSSSYCRSLFLAIVCGLLSRSASAFASHPSLQQHTARPKVQVSLSTATATTAKTSLRSTSSSTDTTSKQQQQQQPQQQQAQLEAAVQQLKKVLQREYASFFNPFERAFYTQDVTFCDPLATLTGLDAYQNNVDMLAGRTLFGKVLFRDASIQLHTIKGGDVKLNEKDGISFSISDITTRWTLRFCFKILPWQPVARFSGISVYQVKAVTTTTAHDDDDKNNDNNTSSVRIVRQDDYWDSINLLPCGERYRKVDQLTAIQDFIGQLQPAATPQQAGPELPYQLLRRGADYEVRQYPAFTAALLPSYERRDEGYAVLGSFCKGLVPMAPSILQIVDNQKTMMWPLTYAGPGQDTPAAPKIVQQDARVQVVTIPSQVVAVGRFTDASVEPVVRKAHRALQASCKRDGLELQVSYDDKNDTADGLQFCQYDAIFSMGQRRGEVWIPLKEGKHPWSR